MAGEKKTASTVIPVVALAAQSVRCDQRPSACDDEEEPECEHL
jgi:hypothetical protein